MEITKFKQFYCTSLKRNYSTCTTNQVFSRGIFNGHTVQNWFQRFCYEDKRLEEGHGYPFVITEVIITSDPQKTKTTK